MHHTGTLPNTSHQMGMLFRDAEVVVTLDDHPYNMLVIFNDYHKMMFCNHDIHHRYQLDDLMKTETNIPNFSGLWIPTELGNSANPDNDESHSLEEVSYLRSQIKRGNIIYIHGKDAVDISERLAACLNLVQTNNSRSYQP